MKQFFKDALFTASMFGPMCVGFALTYLVFAFIAWETNPGMWSWEFRFVCTVFCVSFGAALSIRVAMRRGDL